MSVKKLLCGLLFVSTAFNLWSQPVLIWDIQNYDHKDPFVTPIERDLYLFGSNLTLSTGTPFNRPNGFSGIEWSIPFDANRYIEFSVKPDSGYAFSFEKISFGLIGTQNQEKFELRSSVDNYDSILVSKSARGNNTPYIDGADISSLGVHTDSVTFRLFVYNSVSFPSFPLDSGLYAPEGENLEIFGTLIAPIPEPSVVISGFVCLGIAGWSRWRKFTQNT